MNYEKQTGFYQNKKIIAYVIEGTNTVQRFCYADRPREWLFPLIENGENVDKNKFMLDEMRQKERKDGSIKII